MERCSIKRNERFLYFLLFYIIAGLRVKRREKSGGPGRPKKPEQEKQNLCRTFAKLLQFLILHMI